AFAERLRGSDQPAMIPDDAHGELDELRARVPGLEERQDFAERVLTDKRVARADGACPVGAAKRSRLRFPPEPMEHRAQGEQMPPREDVQAWLDRLELPVESVADDIWLIRTEDGAELAVNFAPPVLVLRVKVMKGPSDAARAGELYRQLLEFNARDLVH